MCPSCWEEYGRPTIINDKVLRAADLTKQVYDAPMGGAGGNLHIVVDDYNIEDGSINFCLGLKEITPVEHELAKLLLSMPLAERASALALDHKFINEAGEVAEWLRP